MDVGNPGEFVIQKWYPLSSTWHDVGAPFSTRRAAENELTQIVNMEDAS